MVLFGEVLDVTKFIPIHPGGPSNTDVTCGEGWMGRPGGPLRTEKIRGKLSRKERKFRSSSKHQLDGWFESFFNFHP